jgi:hypothetical protein
LFSVTDLPQWLELVLNGDGTALLTGTPASNDVDPSITLQVTDGDGATNEQTFFIAIAGSTGGVSYEAWLTENAGLQGDDAFPQADPEGDLVPNVVEFALGGDPLATDTAGLYSVFREGEELYLRHTIRSAAAGVTRTLEASSSFEPEAWENAADRLELVDRSPSGMPGVETLTYRILEVISQPLSGFRVRINSF